MSLLAKISSPADLRRLSLAELSSLAGEIRQFLISSVSKTGGHLGPNLGIVELTIAIHRVFDSPTDPIIFDTGHQSYVHKILTGRAADFATLRQQDGLSGYPSRAESPHDWVENSHASASLSWAEGMAKAFRLQGASERTVVAVIGDGALTGGMTWEALNNIAVESDLHLVIVVNDNGRSYSPTIGGLSRQLSGLRTDPRYEQGLSAIADVVAKTPLVGPTALEFMRAVRNGLKDVLVPQSMFSDLGIKYIGPFDGHNLEDTIRALGQAKRFGGPVIVHAITEKGKGYWPAEHHQDRFHSIERRSEFSGEPASAAVQATWTDAFAQEMVEIGEDHPKVVALTAAMLQPTGLARFAAAYPGRVFDVGIAEQHAVASAAGLAMGGLHPVFAVYSTFLTRAFDQLLMDVSLHHLGVNFALDRAGVTGPDGPSHNGVWDVSLVSIVPGLQLAEPRDGKRLSECLRQAVEIDDHPTVLRYSKGKLPDERSAIAQFGTVDIMSASGGHDVLILGYGALVPTAVAVGAALEKQGIGVTVADPVWALPVSSDVVELARSFRLVVSIEDNLVIGGLGSQVELALDQAGVEVPMRQFGVPREFIAAGTRGEVLERLGLTPQSITRAVLDTVLTLPGTELDCPSAALTESDAVPELDAD